MFLPLLPRCNKSAWAYVNVNNFIGFVRGRGTSFTGICWLLMRSLTKNYDQTNISYIYRLCSAPICEVDQILQQFNVFGFYAIIIRSDYWLKLCLLSNMRLNLLPQFIKLENNGQITLRQIFFSRFNRFKAALLQMLLSIVWDLRFTLVITITIGTAEGRGGLTEYSRSAHFKTNKGFLNIFECDLYIYNI